MTDGDYGPQIQFKSKKERPKPKKDFFEKEYSLVQKMLWSAQIYTLMQCIAKPEIETTRIKWSCHDILRCIKRNSKIGLIVKKSKLTVDPLVNTLTRCFVGCLVLFFSYFIYDMAKRELSAKNTFCCFVLRNKNKKSCCSFAVRKKNKKVFMTGNKVKVKGVKLGFVYSLVKP